MIHRRAWWSCWTLSWQRWSTHPRPLCACPAALNSSGRMRATGLTAACPSGARCPFPSVPSPMPVQLPQKYGLGMSFRKALPSSLSGMAVHVEHVGQCIAIHLSRELCLNAWPTCKGVCVVNKQHHDFALLLQVCRTGICGKQGQHSPSKAKHPLCQVSTFLN